MDNWAGGMYRPSSSDRHYVCNPYTHPLSSACKEYDSVTTIIPFAMFAAAAVVVFLSLAVS
ncbi:hypothetical protein CCHR01_18098 [Colletotrichum chrysophilum]|uniref:Uncharacterized protein n=1 Tax=Colletotrichum chrysophilum TaxID=1836956 RepID=A0AAD9E8Z1_9PEZI|nr:hypothetical protein CCHR01_18098 [Colletotrichum chrysophilum]